MSTWCFLHTKRHDCMFCLHADWRGMMLLLVVTNPLLPLHRRIYRAACGALSLDGTFLGALPTCLQPCSAPCSAVFWLSAAIAPSRMRLGPQHTTLDMLARSGTLSLARQIVLFHTGDVACGCCWLGRGAETSSESLKPRKSLRIFCAEAMCTRMAVAPRPPQTFLWHL